jgi:IS1 family transposase
MFVFSLLVTFAVMRETATLMKNDFRSDLWNSVAVVPTRIATTTETIVHVPVDEEEMHKKQVQFGPIFYNFFVPNTPELTAHAIQIAIEQQLERERTAKNTTLLYTLIGNPNMTSDFCQPNCRQREYLKTGDEVDTYQALWKYCIQHPEKIITYTHDRGSFHNTRSQKRSRRFGTKSAYECRPILRDNLEACNVCTSKFSMYPQYLSSANMWSAHCSYVRKLLAPKIYSASMQSMYDETLFHPNKTSTFGCLHPKGKEENHLGLNRFAPERWIFDHPDVLPCDILPFSLKEAPADFPQEWTPKLRRPEEMIFEGDRGRQRQTSYARLVGRLYQWQYLYGKAPKNTSWIWNAYKGKEDGAPEWISKCLKETGEMYNKSLTTKLLNEFMPFRYTPPSEQAMAGEDQVTKRGRRKGGKRKRKRMKIPVPE